VEEEVGRVARGGRSRTSSVSLITITFLEYSDLLFYIDISKTVYFSLISFFITNVLKIFSKKVLLFS
jgi:hypothetical protein